MQLLNLTTLPVYNYGNLPKFCAFLPSDPPRTPWDPQGPLGGPPRVFLTIIKRDVGHGLDSDRSEPIDQNDNWEFDATSIGMPNASDNVVAAGNGKRGCRGGNPR